MTNLKATFVGVVFIFLSSSCSSSAAIDENIQQALNKEDYSQVLTLTNNALEKEKSNEQLMLIKGFALVRLNRFKEASDYYSDLKKTLPKEPKVGNRLAMVYFSQGFFFRAIKEFEATIKIFPDYEMTYLNLGNAYSRLAEKQYQRGVSATESPLLKNKLMLIRRQRQNIQQSRRGGQQGTNPTTTINQRRIILNALNSWVADWKTLNPDRYFSHYSQNFKPNKGKSLTSWKNRKKQAFAKFAKIGKINIELTNIEIEFQPKNKATVTFTQDYKSDSYKSKSKKVLTMERSNRVWLIIKENS